MKNRFIKFLIILPLLVLVLGSCEKLDDLVDNPNVPGADAIVPPANIYGRLLWDIYSGMGVVSKEEGDVSEGPFRQELSRWCQFWVSNNSYYGGENYYNWSASATPYVTITNINKLVSAANRTYGTKNNPYTALSYFFKAYTYFWYTQRVGDIPMSEAAMTNNLQPKYDTQKEVIKNCLALLDSANIMLGDTKLVGSLSNDIYLNNSISGWRKVVNTFQLRVLINLSKRADDTPDLNIKTRFANIINNASTYPVMTAVADNMQFTYNTTVNKYPINKDSKYNYNTNMSNTLIDILVPLNDPRLYAFATPAKKSITSGKSYADSSAYAGAKLGTNSLGEISTGNSAGLYSWVSYLRYYKDNYVGAEKYIIIGYPEMCFNIAEAINRGWVPGGDAAAWYKKGIQASLSHLSIADGTVIPVGDYSGVKYGNITANVTKFLANPNLQYKGGADGLKQILQQKYVAFFMNSGWEPFMNWRRTGIPTFDEGPGNNASGKIPRRWQYPTNELIYNTQNCQSAIQSQFSGIDDLNQEVWMNK